MMKYFGHSTTPEELVIGKLVNIFFDPVQRNEFEGKAYLQSIGEVLFYHNGHALRTIMVRFYGEDKRNNLRTIMTDEKEGE